MCVGRSPKEEAIGEAHESISLKRMSSTENVSAVPQEKTVFKEYSNDLIAVITCWTRDAVYSFNKFSKSLQNSTIYRVFSSTTQPAHAVVVIVILYLSYIYLTNRSATATITPIWTLVYLGSFSAHFGAQIWMTFISGLSLYFSLPRHTFGSVQKILFPRYFFLNSILSMITLVIFLKVKTNDLRTAEISIQVLAMLFCFFVELLIFLYLVPPLTILIKSKTEIEKQAGNGTEVGKFELGDLCKCPHYIKILKAFRKVHMTIAIGNMCALGCTSLHLYYLASRLCILSL